MENVESFYPLTPMQQGMLFHSISGGEREVFCQQLSCTLQGPLDVEAFSEAWRTVVDEHDILRTFFLWEGAKEPVQVVRERVELPLEFFDWRSASADEQRRQIEQFLVADRERGFDLMRAPLTRVALLRMADEEHEMLWTHHHILLDGTSVHRIIKAVFGHYEALVIRQPQRAPAGNVPPFSDYIRWLHRQDASAAKTHWREMLRGFTEPTALVACFGASTESRGVRVATETAVLPAKTYTKLAAFARSARVTVNTVFQGAWALLLSRYTDQGDVVFGATASGRPHDLPRSDDMVGIFINTLPVRAVIDPRANLVEWLQSLQKQQARSRQFEYTPLYEIQAWSEVSGETPLFDTILAFANYEVESAAWKTDGSLRIGRFQPWESSNYPLNAYVEPGPECGLGMVYQVGHFSEAAIRRMLGHWAALLEGIAANPDRVLGELPMLSEAERQTLLSAWNDTAMEIPAGVCTHELVAQVASSSPDATALGDRERTLSYAQLDSEANRLAHYLGDLGIRRGDLVAVCMPRTSELIVAELAILKAGAAYVPLDPEFPADRLRFMVEDCGASVLLSQTSLRDALPVEDDQNGVGPRVVFVDASADAIARQSDRAPDAGATPEDLAYVIYTSGSTGRPKGTLITHSALLNLCLWHRRDFELSPDDRATQVAGPAFDAFGWEVWPYFTCGASVRVVPPDVVASPKELRDWLVEQAITVSFLPTPLAERLLSLDWPDDPALRRLLVGGDRLHQAPPPELPFELVNNYGPTENTVVSTSGRVEASEGDDGGGAPPIGRPIANTQVYLLDQNLAPVPMGVLGELHVAGAGLSVGYHNRPDLTAEKFIRNPFSNDASARLYRTGDRARYRSDGSIEFHGRIDFQVKVRGYRIELGEIEGVLNLHPAVQESVVLAIEAGTTETQLVAYVVRSEETPTVEDFRTWLSTKLPEYMVPARFVWMKELPLTPNGKVDRRGLPDPTADRPELEAEFLAPESDVEQTIAKVWREVLALDRVGRNDNFFDLGGHSLSMMKIFAVLRSAFARELVMVDLFAHPTVASLAAFVRSDGSESGGAKAGVERAAVRRKAMKRKVAKRPGRRGGGTRTGRGGGTS